MRGMVKMVEQSEKEKELISRLGYKFAECEELNIPLSWEMYNKIVDEVNKEFE